MFKVIVSTNMIAEKKVKPKVESILEAAVETFVDTTRYLGTCYKAANWIKIGQTKGRSRQDRNSTLMVPIKDIFVYPMRRNFREVLLA